MNDKIFATAIILVLLVIGSCERNNTVQEKQAGVPHAEENIMKTDNVFTVPERIWHNKTPFSPGDSREPGLDFNLQPALNSTGPTVALLANYYLGQPILNYYGGQLPSPVHVVAIRSDTGCVYHRECMEDDGIPVSVHISESDFDRQSNNESDSFESAFFNIDLCEHLSLPPEAGTYYVFLWIDDIVSPIKTAQVTANQSRVESGLPSNQQLSSIVEFGVFPTPALSRGQQIVLAPSLQFGDRTIYGVRFLDTIDNRHGSKSAPCFLTLLAFNHRDRRFGWISVDINQLPPGTDSSRFRIDPMKIAGFSEIRQKNFTLAVLGTAISNVLVSQFE